MEEELEYEFLIGGMDSLLQAGFSDISDLLTRPHKHKPNKPTKQTTPLNPDINPP